MDEEIRATLRRLNDDPNLVDARRLVRQLERKDAEALSPDQTLWWIAHALEKRSGPRRKTILCVLQNGLYARARRIETEELEAKLRRALKTDERVEILRKEREWTARQLSALSARQLVAIPGVGDTTIAYARALLDTVGLELAGDTVTRREATEFLWGRNGFALRNRPASQ